MENRENHKKNLSHQKGTSRRMKKMKSSQMKNKSFFRNVSPEKNFYQTFIMVWKLF